MNWEQSMSATTSPPLAKSWRACRSTRASAACSSRRGEVVALERGALYGLPVYANRRVAYGPIDAAAAHEVFIRSALVHGELETRAPFLAHNRRLVAEIERLEHKSRRPDILVDEELIHAFYDARLPPDVHSASALEHWRAQAEKGKPKLLFLAREDLM